MQQAQTSKKSTDPPRDADFFDRVWQVVERIPRGRVTTYGHIAAFLGSRSASRTVGWALGAAKGTLLPCHRVVNREGALSGRMKFGGPEVMADMLRSEGVLFDDDGRVLLERHLWDPSAGQRVG
jgi:O-6-methylguanine DNA methyltransferase